MKKPNVLLIMADQLAPQFLPTYGHKVVQAPHIEALGRSGVVFDAAYTNAPLCAPSRYVMMSGRLPSKIAAWDNAAEFASEVPTFAHYLSAEGYATCLSGKMHFVGPDQLHGFDQRLTSDVYPSDFTWHPRWDRPGERLDWYHNMNVVTQAGPCTRSMYLDYDDEAVFHAKRYLFDHARAGGDKPFMLCVSMIQPHDPYLCRPERWDTYREDDIDLPVTPYGSVPEDPLSARLRHGYGASDQSFDEATLRGARRAYYGSVTDIDAKLGELMATLEEARLAEDTIVIFTSDHGDMLGERGMWFKMSYYEHSGRVPLVVHFPQAFAARRVPQAVSLVDLLPTLTELARDGEAGDYATPLEGRSLLPHLNGDGAASGHDEVIGEYFGEGVSAPMFMVRRGTTKYIQCEGDPAQFYDLAVDPHERTNLAGDASHAASVDALRSEVDAGYDCERLSALVHESQQRRLFLSGVMREQGLNWDYEPRRDASRDWVRNSMPIYELEKRARFPVV